MVLIPDIWKCTPITLNIIKFIKDYLKDSYNIKKFIEKNINDMNILTTLKNTHTFLNVEF